MVSGLRKWASYGADAEGAAGSEIGVGVGGKGRGKRMAEGEEDGWFGRHCEGGTVAVGKGGAGEYYEFGNVEEDMLDRGSRFRYKAVHYCE